MTIIDLKDQIIKNNLSNFYIFTGTEIGIINIYLQQMSNKLGLPITRADSILSIYGKCQGGSLFGDSTGFYVIRDDRDFMKQEQLFDTIKTSIRKNVIVLLYDKIDSRLKFGKHFKDDIVAFEKLTPNVLKSYIKKEIPLYDKNIETLMEVCGGSYDMCMLEVDKVEHYSNWRWENRDFRERDGGILNINESFEELLRCGVIYQPEETDVFKFTEAVCNRNKKLAFELEQVLMANNNSSINILGTLYNSMKSVMLIQVCESKNISEVTGLDNRLIYFNKKYVGKYSSGELVKAIKLISKVIEGVKNGWIDDVYATKFVLVNIL